MSHSIDLPTDLYQQAVAIAAETASTVDEVVTRLLREEFRLATTTTRSPDDQASLDRSRPHVR